jgi:hypothetical protein
MPATPIPGATARQRTFIDALCRTLSSEVHRSDLMERVQATGDIITALSQRTMTVSAGISALIALRTRYFPPNSSAAETYRKNEYAGPCAVCHQTVAPRAGRLMLSASGQWLVAHVKECPEPAPSTPTLGATPTVSIPTSAPSADFPSVAAAIPRGVHVLDGTLYRVRDRRGYSRPSIARGRVIQDLSRRSGHRIRWTYSPWTVYHQVATQLSTDTLVTADYARTFGLAHGICVACSADLTDERSVALGYGPVCARRYGWPVPY